jgi:hypothetical protein
MDVGSKAAADPQRPAVPPQTMVVDVLEFTRIREALASMQRENAAMRREQEMAKEQRRRDIQRRISMGQVDPEDEESDPTSSSADMLSPPRISAQRVNPAYSSHSDQSSTGRDDPTTTLTAEQRILWKAASKMRPPEKFNGTSPEEKRDVGDWVDHANRYMDGIFQFLPAPAERTQHVMSYLTGPALDWVKTEFSEVDGRFWSEMQKEFISYIKGGGDTKALLKQQYDALAYGRGKCTDVLSFNREFDSLRLQIWPTSNREVALNQRCGDDYGKAVKRGNPEMYKEMLRMLGLEQEPMLKRVKDAAAKAALLLDVDKEITGSSGNSQSVLHTSYRPPQRQWIREEKSSSSKVAAQNIKARELDESQSDRAEGEQDTASLQAVNASSPERRGWKLTEDQRGKLMKAGRCFVCYQKEPGHLARNCKNSSPGRAPKLEELKA